MTRLYGRAPKGEPVLSSVPQNHGQNVTMVGALGTQGLQAVMTIDGATDTEGFRIYVKHVLGPTLVPGDIIIMNNLGAHKVVGIQQILARRGAQLLHVLPYWPDLSPVEPL
jgi:transposase